MANFVLQLYRNSALLENRAAAIAALEGKVAGRKDGEMVLARYTNGGSVSAVLGIINKVGNQNVLTVLEDNINAVPAKIAEAISSAKGQLESAYKEADAQLKTAYEAADAKIREDFADEAAAIRDEFAAADTLLSDRIGDLEGLMDGEGDGSVDKRIEDAIAGLDVATIGGDGKFIQSVTETDGKISAVTMDATAANIAIADADGKFTAENVEAALAEIHTGYTGEASAIRGEFADADKTLKEGYEAADKAINDKIGTVTDGKTVVSMIEEAADAAAAAHSKVAKAENAAHLTITSAPDENGAVTYTIGENNIASADALSGVDGRLVTAEGKITTLEDLMNGEADGSVNKRIDAAVEEAVEGLMGETSETDAKTIAALNDKIEAVQAAAKSYEIKEVTEGLDANIKEAFALFDEEGKKVGSTINIYKDSSLKEVKLEGQILKFTYILFDGQESTVGVDVSTFLSESEFGNGLQVVEHIVSVKVDAASESFLTVGADGIKLAGVADAIKTADDKVREDFAAEDTKIRGEFANADTAIRGEFAAADTAIRGEFAAADKALGERVEALEGLMGNEGDGSVDARIEAAIEALSSEKTGDGAFVDVTVKQENGVITSVSVAESNIAKADELDIAEGKITALEGLVGKTAVATQIDNKVATLNSNKTADGTFVDVVLKQENGIITSFTISETNIAAADELDIAEGKITALEGLVGKTAVSTQIDNKINGLNVTDNAVAGQYVSQVSESAGKIAVTRNALLGAETDNALSMGTNGGVYMSTTIDCGVY